MHKLIAAVLLIGAFSFTGVVSAQVGVDTSLSITKDEAAAMSLDAESAELSADAVVTSEDLSSFATSHMKRDAAMEQVVAASDHVSVEYRKGAHFLGFIPGSLRATAEVSSAGTVEVDYPWYRFLFSMDGGSGSDLQAEISDIMAGADTSAGLDAHTQARLIDALHTSLQGSLGA